MEITSAPESIFLNKGETAVLECEVSDGEVIWYKGGEEIFEEENVRLVAELFRVWWSFNWFRRVKSGKRIALHY